jgi:two-component system chemotaxis response regulator CheY
LHLKREGYENILTAENGQKVIEILNQGDNIKTVSLILCDIKMPNVNGMDAVDKFKKIVPNTPVIIVTGYEDSEIEAYMNKKGIKGYLVKPVEKQKLITCVNKVIADG